MLSLDAHLDSEKNIKRMKILIRGSLRSTEYMVSGRQQTLICFWILVRDSCARDVAGETSSCRLHCPEMKSVTDFDINRPHRPPSHGNCLKSCNTPTPACFMLC